MDLLGHQARLARGVVHVLGELRQQHHELIAAEARDHVVLASHVLQATRDRLQQRVADRMAERVVDALELVHVDEQQRAAAAAPRRSREAGLETLGEVAAIG